MARRRSLRSTGGEVIVSRGVLVARLTGRVSGLTGNLAELQRTLTDAIKRCEFALVDGASMLDEKTLKIIKDIKTAYEKQRDNLPQIQQMVTKADELVRQIK